MKVMRKEESFKPVTIVLESQDELDWLFCCLASTSSRSQANLAFANEFGRVDRFSNCSSTLGFTMYEAVRKLMGGEYK